MNGDKSQSTKECPEKLMDCLLGDATEKLEHDLGVSEIEVDQKIQEEI